MRMYDLIEKKKEGKRLSTEEIRWMILGYTNGSIPDYQMSAMLMAVCFQGMDEKETLELTLAMRDSGDILDLSAIDGVKVDKHSTGGVGDKTSLILTPMIAALGVPVAKMSGRGLGHTGGTIDKLECFDGFRTDISEEQFFRNVNTIGIAIAGQTATLAPADKKLYALRDVTATVAQLSLIASSIMSKKLASGSDAIVLDVKTGNGAFMQKEEDAISLAKTMVKIGELAGKKTAALVTDMSKPLGNMVGNSLEVIEAIEALKGNAPKDLMDDVYALGAQMLLLAGAAENEERAYDKLQQVIADGRALDKLAELVEAQGGNRQQVYDTGRLPKASMRIPVYASAGGYIHSMDTTQVGIACMTLGGGRETKESTIDPAVGIELVKKTGDHVKKGDVLAWLHANDEKKAASAEQILTEAYHFSTKQPQAEKTVRAVITAKTIG